MTSNGSNWLLFAVRARACTLYVRECVHLLGRLFMVCMALITADSMFAEFQDSFASVSA